MSTKAEYLLARYAEEKALARGAGAEGVTEWWYDPTKVNSVDRGEAVFGGLRGPMAITVASTGPADDPQSMRDAAHIAYHDPAHVLRDIAAKRRIVTDWISLAERLDGLGRPLHLFDPATSMLLKATEPWIRALLSVYAYRDDFPEEWR